MSEIIEGTAVEVGERPPEGISGWGGATPFFLVLEFDERRPEGNLGIDLDSPWTTTHAEHLRRPGIWWLFHKQTRQPVMGLVVHEGDQPYFTRHHVGNLMRAREIVVYGLGKKCADGTMVRNWLLPNGIVCGGDDADEIGARIVNRM